VIGGRAGLGKTSLGMTIAHNIAKIDKSVLFLSLEMSANLLALRTISGITGIDADLIERGRLDNEQLKKVQSVTAELGKMKFGILDDSTDSESFLEYAVEYKEKFGLDVVFIDYLSLLRDPQTFGDTERVGRISRNVRTIARECNIPVVALVQLNREVEKRENHKPILSDIRSSGDIEQDAFAVLFAYRPHYYAMMHDGEDELAVEKDAEIIIAKNRQGKTGATRALFYPTQMRWEQNPPQLKEPPQTLVEKVRQARERD
jgi:replicative DNA helicase